VAEAEVLVGVLDVQDLPGRGDVPGDTLAERHADLGVLHAQGYLGPKLVGVAVEDENIAAVAVDDGLDLLGDQLKQFGEVRFLGNDPSEIYEQAQPVFQFFNPFFKIIEA